MAGGSLHNPSRWRLTRGIISNSSTRRGEVAAKLQWETSRFLAEFTQVADRKTVASWQKRFAQVQISRILTRIGEVAAGSSEVRHYPTSLRWLL